MDVNPLTKKEIKPWRRRRRRRAAKPPHATPEEPTRPLGRSTGRCPSRCSHRRRAASRSRSTTLPSSQNGTFRDVSCHDTAAHCVPLSPSGPAARRLWSRSTRPRASRPRHAHDTPATRPRHARDTSATCPRHVRKRLLDAIDAAALRPARAAKPRRGNYALALFLLANASEPMLLPSFTNIRQER